MSKDYQQTWDLDVIFEGGSESTAFHSYIENLRNDIDSLITDVSAFTPPTTIEEGQRLVQIITQINEVTKALGESSAFVSCLHAQDVTDKNASLLRSKINAIYATYASILTTVDQKLIQMEENLWNTLLQTPELKEVAFVLNERRLLAKEKLPLEQEKLINDLAVDGYHAWGEMYDAIVGKITIPFEEDGEVKELSVGQASNKMDTSDRETRRQVFQSLQQAWSEQEDFFSETINHLAGFRLQTYKHRQWDSVLKEPLAMNRMSEQT